MKKEKYLKARRNAIRRCTEPRNNRYKYYGAKGVKCLLSREDVVFLAKRDGADNMKKPQLHRKIHTKNYTLDNCSFIEATLHSHLTHIGAKRSVDSRKRMSESGGTLFGENHGMAKLTNTQVREIKRSSMKGVDLARQFCVAPSTISAIRRGQNWRKI